jgi:6-phosphogluconolactonase
MSDDATTQAQPGATVEIRPDAATAAADAATRIATSLTATVGARGVAHWMTTGGSNPVEIYKRLLMHPLRDDVPWGAVHVWWTDDRYVPRDHPLSNVKAFDDVLINLAGAEEGTLGGGGGMPGVPIPPEHYHPFRTGEAIGNGHGPTWAAERMIEAIRAAGIDTRDGWPVFDLVLLGLGSDGHVLSVFPGSAVFDSTDWATAVPAPTHIEPHVERVTMHPAVITVAREVLMVVTGAGKADAVAAVFGDDGDERRWPGKVARRPGATWLLDEEAAARLPR